MIYESTLQNMNVMQRVFFVKAASYTINLKLKKV